MALHLPNEYGQDQGIQRVLIVIPSSIYFQSGIRDFTLHMVRNLTDLSEQWAFRFQTIVDELCNNAIEYGSATGDDIAVTYYVKKGDWLEVTVEDKGTGAKCMEAAELTALVETRKKQEGDILGSLRGRGLAKIVSRWTDELEFSDRPAGGLKARARKYFKNIV